MLLAFCVWGIHRAPLNSHTKANDAELWYVFFLTCCVIKGLSKKSRRQWFETSSRSLWRYCNVPYIVNSTAADDMATPRSIHSAMVLTLTHWGRVTHICVSTLTIIGSDNGLSPDRRQAIIWTIAGILLSGPLGTNFSEIWSEIHTFSFKKICLKMSSGKWRPFCLGLNVLIFRDIPVSVPLG